MSLNLGILIPIIAVILIIIMVIVAGYVKAPPDKAFIISGMRKEPRILIGQAGVKIPFFERVDKLYLGQMTVDIKTEQSVPTNDFINVNVDAVAKVRIGTDTDSIQLAAKNFLNKAPEEITIDLQDSLQGNMREIIGTLSLKTINTDRDSFSDQVMEKASKDMKKLGIEILSCNIQNVTDENGLIKDLGADNTARIKKDASIAKAQADRDVAIAQAEADKAANDARVLAQTEIAEKNNALAIKQAELKKQADTAAAVADAAYTIQEQEQQKTIETATVNAQIAKTEREAELRQKQVEVKQQELDAEIKKVADAKKYAAEQEAAADLIRRQRKAEAEKYEQEQAALARMKKAEADKYEKEQEAEAKKAQAEAKFVEMAKEAEGIAAKGKAEAQAIEAKGLAEAEAMEKKAEAMKKYGQAAMMEMIVKALPEMAQAVAKPLESIDKVTIIDSGNGDGGVGSMGSYVPSVLAKTIESVKETTGLDITEIMKANTYDAKVTRNVNITGLEDASDNVKKEVVAAVVKDTVDSEN